MKAIDLVVERPRTYQGFIEAQWNHAQTNLLIGRGRYIDIKSEMDCWNCRKAALIGKFDFYCSPACRDAGEAQEDSWRNE